MIYACFYVFYLYRYRNFYLEWQKNGYVLQQITSTSGTCDTAALPSLPDITDDLSSHQALQLMLTNPSCLHTEGRTAFLLYFLNVLLDFRQSTSD
jgi:hypothetical protein